MSSQNNLLENELIVDNIAATHLIETIKWARFLAIMGFIISGLITIVTLSSGLFFSHFTRSQRGDVSFLKGGMVVYFAIAVVTFFMSRFLFQFAKKTQTAIKASDQATLAAAFKNLKIYFRFAGIVTIICLIFSILAVISLMIVSSFSRY